MLPLEFWMAMLGTPLFSSGASDMAVTADVAVASDVSDGLVGPAVSATVDGWPLLPLPDFLGRSRLLAERLDPQRISVRGVDQELWDFMYVESARNRIPLGQLLNVLINEWRVLPENERRAAILRYRRPDEDP